LNVRNPSGFQEFISWLYDKTFTSLNNNILK
jgi:hypothetical protein